MLWNPYNKRFIYHRQEESKNRIYHSGVNWSSSSRTFNTEIHFVTSHVPFVGMVSD